MVVEKKKEVKSGAKKSSVIYVGQVPHGFYEKQMHEYFGQFGDITKLKLARSKLTGNQKGHGFIEYKEASVAKIVAETMNQYLFFDKLLKCHVVDVDKVHTNMFKGYKPKHPLPAQINRKKFNKPKDLKEIEACNAKRLKRLSASLKKLKDLGIECEPDIIGDKNDNIENAIEEEMPAPEEGNRKRKDMEDSEETPASKKIKTVTKNEEEKKSAKKQLQKRKKSDIEPKMNNIEEEFLENEKQAEKNVPQSKKAKKQIESPKTKTKKQKNKKSSEESVPTSKTLLKTKQAKKQVEMENPLEKKDSKKKNLTKSKASQNPTLTNKSVQKKKK